MELNMRAILENMEKQIEAYGQKWRKIGQKEGFNEGVMFIVNNPDSPELLKKVAEAASQRAYDGFMTS